MKKLLSLMLMLALLVLVTSNATAQEPVGGGEEVEDATEEVVEEVEESVGEPVEEPVSEDAGEAVEEAVEEEVEGVGETVSEPVDDNGEAVEEFEPVGDPGELSAAQLDDSELSGSAAATTAAWSSTLYLSNPNNAATTANIVYYDTSGGEAATVPQNLNAFGSAVIDVTSVNDNFQGSAIVSADQSLAVQVALKAGPEFDRTLYTGYTQGGSKISSPGTLCNTFSQTTELAVMNVGSSAATVNVNYLAAGNYTPATKTTNHTIPANSSVYLDACTELGIDSNWNGSVTVEGQTGSESLTGIIFLKYTDSPKATTYETLVDEGSEKIYFPQALNRSFGSEQSTFYAIQNVGTSDTTITVEAFAGDGSSAGTKTQILPAGEKVTITPEDLNIPQRASFSGSAVATASAGGQIAAITQLRVFADKAGCEAGSGIASQYLNPGTKASDSSYKVAIPWAEFKTSGTDWQSFIAIQNVSDTATGNVTVTYYGPDGNTVGTRAVDPVGGGNKVTVNSKDDIASGGDNFLGSVVVESSNTSDGLVVMTSNKQANECAGANTLGIPVQ